MRERAYKGEEREGVGFQELCKRVQASDGEIEEELSRLGAFEIEG